MHYGRYPRSLPKEFGINTNALTAKVVIEGGIYVGLKLFAEAMEDQNYELAEAIRASFRGARDWLNRLDLGEEGTEITEEVEGKDQIDAIEEIAHDN